MSLPVGDLNIRLDRQDDAHSYQLHQLVDCYDHCKLYRGANTPARLDAWRRDLTWRVRRCAAAVCGGCGWLAFTKTRDCLTLNCDCTWLCYGLWTANLTQGQRTALQYTSTPEAKALWFQAARISDSLERSTITMWQSCVFPVSILFHVVTDWLLTMFLSKQRS